MNIQRMTILEMNSTYISGYIIVVPKPCDMDEIWRNGYFICNAGPCSAVAVNVIDNYMYVGQDNQNLHR